MFLCHDNVHKSEAQEIRGILTNIEYLQILQNIILYQNQSA